MTVTATVEEVSRDFGAWLDRLVESHDEFIVIAHGRPAARVIPINNPPLALEAARLLQGDGSSDDDDSWEADIARGRAVLRPLELPKWD